MKLSVFAVMSNVMFYHREYDFVTLLIPLAYAILMLPTEKVICRFAKGIIFANILWSFFLSRAMRLPQPADILVCAMLQHCLLSTLVAMMFIADRSPEAARLNDTPVSSI